MGLDLTLCPIKHGDRIKEWWLGYDRLSFERDYDLFEQFDSRGRAEEDTPPKVCNPQPIPVGVEFDWYGDEGVTKRNEDPYGKSLTFIRAFEVHKIDTTHCGSWNRAIIEFLKSLPPQIPIVLWWH